MNKITKVIIETAETHNLKTSKVYESFIEMSYQLVTTTTFDIKFKYLNDDFFYFTMHMHKEVQNNPFKDILGETLFEINSLDKKNLSQCFTPPSVTNGIRLMMNDSVGGKNGRFSDPTCGSGALVLAQLNSFSKSSAKQVDLVINDIDELMVKTALFQSQLNIHLHCADKETPSITAYCVDLISGWNRTDALVSHRNINLIDDPYVKGYVEVQRRKELTQELIKFMSNEVKTNQEIA